MGILIGVFCVAIYTDWRYYKIPNACIVVGMTAGLTATYLSHSMSGLLEALGMAAIIFLAFYPFYRLGALGAGDVKLFMTVGCYRSELGGNGIAHYLFVTMIIAAAITIVKMIAYAESRERLFYLARYLRKVAMTGAVDAYQINKTQKRCIVRLSIPAFMSLLLMCAGMYA